MYNVFMGWRVQRGYYCFGTIGVIRFNHTSKKYVYVKTKRCGSWAATLCGCKLILTFLPKQLEAKLDVHVTWISCDSLVVNPITVYSYGFFFNCTTVGQASDRMKAVPKRFYRLVGA